MLYLEDYLEMIEHLPQHFRDTLTQMRELDLQVHNDMDDWELRVNRFFGCAHTMLPEIREAQFGQLKQDFNKTLEAAEEKVSTASNLFELVDKYLRKLEQELHKFKIELEADNAGITEILEKRSLELDNPPSSSNHLREKRKLGIANSGDQKLNLFANDKMPHMQDNFNLTPNNFASMTDKNSLNHKLKYMASGNAVIAAAASQAIHATQTMQLGRRSQSLKATIDAVNSPNGFSNFPLNSIHLDDPDTSSQNNLLRNPNQQQLLDLGLTKKRNKKSRTSHQFMLETLDGSPYDQKSDERYCICNGPSYGDMIFCENSDCKNGVWFHYDCVGIKEAPKGSWYCIDCKKRNDKDKKKKEKVYM